MILLDICPVEQFAKGHIPGSIETNAYPVDTDEQRARLASDRRRKGHPDQQYVHRLCGI
jgi:rhodanese-related sulfurtransferase